jgi:hypothetical protein
METLLVDYPCRGVGLRGEGDKEREDCGKAGAVQCGDGNTDGDGSAHY